MLLPATPTIKPGHRVSKATTRPVILDVTDTRVWHLGQVLSKPSVSDLTCFSPSPTPDQMTGSEKISNTPDNVWIHVTLSRSNPPSHPKFIDPPFKNPCPFRQNTILVTGTNCNGYGIWINKTKLCDGLMMFNLLRVGT